ncbi:chondroadherin-like protein [Alosa sapidissima]|uniref:chondroadherin-like protein n=1 Tax=Alosa sapidissima TaxID=34773 RepID=UPI001C088407|nr:chondroadherin-like protein [Alosa sapidissima]XP_041938950.1 chondroadherin-like protein [Alosa sapidissima]XP_041938951.1 chondroadherin-like protein [Alosa sapidissima]
MYRHSLDAGSHSQTIMLHFSILIFARMTPVMGTKICPAQCLCYDSAELVDCRDRGFTHVPHGIPHGSWLLDLSKNDIQELRSRSFTGLWALKVLLMSNCGIKVVQSNALNSLSFIEKLDLSHNQLQVLPSDFSEGLDSLKDLRLAHNSLGRLDSSALQRLENLQRLDLSHNYIQVLEPGMLRALTSLRHLNLRWNLLREVPMGMLTMQQGLSVLLLDQNNVTYLDAEAFTPLRGLTLLSLQGNQLWSLDFRTFLNLQTRDTHLQLSGNPWVCDCELHRVFAKLLHVRHLHVDDYANVTCRAPPLLAGASLAYMDNQLCVAEMATVLVISVTVIVTVVAAMVMAERNRKRKKLNQLNQENKWGEQESMDGQDR